MLALFEIFTKRKNKRKLSSIREESIQNFSMHPEHQWILEDPEFKRAFEYLFDSLDDRILAQLSKHKPVIFIKSSGRLSLVVPSQDQAHIVMLFPDLIKVMHSASPLRAVAILAHELGHIYLDHAHKDLDDLSAQLEADEFSFHLGWGGELFSVLEDHSNSRDCRLRLQNLSRLFKSKEAYEHQSAL